MKKQATTSQLSAQDPLEQYLAGHHTSFHYAASPIFFGHVGWLASQGVKWVIKTRFARCKACVRLFRCGRS